MRGVVREEPCRGELRERVRQLERDTLEVGDPRAERRPFDGVVTSQVTNALMSSPEDFVFYPTTLVLKLAIGVRRRDFARV